MNAPWPTAAATTLADITERWGRYYHIAYEDGAYKATRPDGVVLPEADTPEGIDSAIRADFSRWHSR